MTFENLGLLDSILDALHRQGYTAPTPIQAGAIPAVLQGRDVLDVYKRQATARWSWTVAVTTAAAAPARAAAASKGDITIFLHKIHPLQIQGGVPPFHMV